MALALYVLSRNRITITDSWFQGNRVGVTFDAEEESSLEIRNSRFLDNEVGLAFGTVLLRPNPVDSITAWIEDSVFFGNRRYGLYLWNPYRLAIEGNTIEENRTGVMIDRSSNVLQLSRNAIRWNREWGVALRVLPCEEGAPEPFDLAERFLLQGEDNEIQDNGRGDLCPPDYPWPESFTKP